MARKLTGGLLVSIVSLWFAAFEGWAGKQINRKGSLKLHCATFGIPKMKRQIHLSYPYSEYKMLHTAVLKEVSQDVFNVIKEYVKIKTM